MKQQKHAGRRNGFLHNADYGADRRGGIAGHFEQFWHACRTMQNGDFGKFCYTQLRHSLCPGWASGPTSFLSRHVLGIKPIEAGYKKIKKVWCENGNEFTPVNVTAADAPVAVPGTTVYVWDNNVQPIIAKYTLGAKAHLIW